MNRKIKDSDKLSGLEKGKKSGMKDDKISSQRKPVVNTGSTTQGGSNFGQGSMELGSKSNKQGARKNKGSNYDNEEGFDI